MINKYKVIVSRVFFEHAGQSSKDGNYRVLSILETLRPKEVCTETYIVVDSFDKKEEADHLLKYLKTKFVRYLILQAASSIMITRGSFIFVPDFDFNSTGDINWDDSVTSINEQLYSYFGLTEKERSIIEASIKEME